MNYLDFEKPIEELQEQLDKIQEAAVKSGMDVSKITSEMEEKIKEARLKIYGNLCFKT